MIEIKDNCFYLGGRKKLPIISGSFHYFRIEKKLWPSIFDKIKRRWKFLVLHLRLIRAMKFKHFYTIRGRLVNPYKLLLLALLRGRFLSEIVAMNTKWENNK